MADSEEMNSEATGGELFLSDTQVASRYGVRRSTVWSWSKAGRIPQPMKLSPGCSRWRLSGLEAFERAREVSA